MTPRTRLRRILMLAGLLPALLVVAYAVKIGLMLDANADGRAAFHRGDIDIAADDFAGTRRLNWFESWVAAFDEGAAEHARGEYDDAIAAYEAALADVPDPEECTVRINLALAHEALGDAAAETGAIDEATAAWQAGIDALAAGDCPTDSGRGEEQTEDAAAVAKRLREKLEQSQQQPEPQPQPDPPQPEDPGESDPRRDRLEEQNDRGLDQRREDQDLYKDEDYARPDTW